MLRTSVDREGWLELVAESLRHQGAAIVEGAIDAALLAETRQIMYRVQEHIVRDVGRSRLERAGELGVLRLMMKYDPVFFRYLEIPAILAIVDRTVGGTGILHLQNGFILPTLPVDQPVSIFQTRFHQDFPRVLGGFLASINVLIAIDPFRADRGATWVVPASHQRAETPLPEYLEAAAVCAECPAGSLLVFDSTLWHRAGHNTSGQDRLAINHQFTRSYFKQQIDYVRALGDAQVTALPPRTQQLLGWYTRVVTSLDEYYQPEERRLYRRGQG